MVEGGEVPEVSEVLAQLGPLGTRRSRGQSAAAA